MVLGLGSRKGPAVKVEFLIRILEIKPWKAAATSRTSVYLHWQRGDKRSGKTRIVVPVLEDGGKIVFNDSFKLPATLYQEPDGKGKRPGAARFQKKCVVFELLDSTDQTMARCVLDLADYGAINAPVTTNIPLAAGQRVPTGGKTPALFLSISLSGNKDQDSSLRRSTTSPLSSTSRSSPLSSKSKVEPDLDDEQRESIVAALMSDDDDEDANVDDGIDSFTDDESLHGSGTVTPRVESKPDGKIQIPSISPAKMSLPPKDLQLSGASSAASNSTLAAETDSYASSLEDEDIKSPGHEVVYQPEKLKEDLWAEKDRPLKLSPSPLPPTPAKSAAAAAVAAVYVTRRAMRSKDVSSSQGSSGDFSSDFPALSFDDTLTGSSNGARSPSLGIRSPSLGRPYPTRPAPAIPVASGETYSSKEKWSSNEDYTDDEFEAMEDDHAEDHTRRTSVLASARLKLAKVEKKAVEGVPDIFSEKTAVEESKIVSLTRTEKKAVEEARVVPLMKMENKAAVEEAVLTKMEEKSLDKGLSGAPKSKMEKTSLEVKTVSPLARMERKPVLPKVDKKELEEPKSKAITAGQLDEDDTGSSSVLGSARANMAKVEQKALEELRLKIANVEAKHLFEVEKGEERTRQYEQEKGKLQGELCDTAAIEIALYSVVPEHGSSSHKVHTPARRLARLYMYACKHWSPERRASAVRNSISGLILVAKACGTDVSRLTFWWSNIVVLRATVAQVCERELLSTSQADTSGTFTGNSSPTLAQRSIVLRKSLTRQETKLPSIQIPPSAWQESGTYIAALEAVEAWIHLRVIESLWWQAMTPPMQQSSSPVSPKGSFLLPPTILDLTSTAKEELNKFAGDVKDLFVKKQKETSLPELGDARQGNISVEIWKKALLDVCRRLCPVRGEGHDCGCLAVLTKMAIDECVARLDVAIFNAILRDSSDDVPTDPISDPISDPSVLPISPGGLTFGAGSQLKNVVVTWSTWLSTLVSTKEPIFLPDSDPETTSESLEINDKTTTFFNLIKATGDLLMLPKEILMDRQMRKEICPMLSLALIRKILAAFVPDEFAPEPVTPSLLAAINAEASLESRRQGEAEDDTFNAMASAPSTAYNPPSASFIWPWIGEASNNPAAWGHNSTSLLRKGYTSDEELENMEQPLALLQERPQSLSLETTESLKLDGMVTQNGNHHFVSPTSSEDFWTGIGTSGRFQFLKQVWTSQ